jgi:hypothetical protein
MGRPGHRLVTLIDDQTTVVEHFKTHDWMRVPAALAADEAAAMRDAVWRALEGIGIRRDRPSTWTPERPVHLKRLKKDPVFQAVKSERVRAAIESLLEGPHNSSRSPEEKRNLLQVNSSCFHSLVGP